MKNHTLSLKISGITCDACIKLIKRKVEKLTEVTEVNIKDNNGETTIISTRELKASDIIAALSGMPFTVVGA